MIEQATAAGLRVDPSMVDHLCWGTPRRGSNHIYLPPSATAPLHDSMNAAWEILEWLPKEQKYREWPANHGVHGWYLPRSEPRFIPEEAIIHQSVIDRKANTSYQPVNMPRSFTVEPDPVPPPLPPPPSPPSS
jgi:hypothetical protein